MDQPGVLVGKGNGLPYDQLIQVIAVRRSDELIDLLRADGCKLILKQFTGLFLSKGEKYHHIVKLPSSKRKRLLVEVVPAQVFIQFPEAFTVRARPMKSSSSSFLNSIPAMG